MGIVDRYRETKFLRQVVDQALHSAPRDYFGGRLIGTVFKGGSAGVREQLNSQNGKVQYTEINMVEDFPKPGIRAITTKLRVPESRFGLARIHRTTQRLAVDDIVKYTEPAQTLRSVGERIITVFKLGAQNQAA